MSQGSAKSPRTKPRSPTFRALGRKDPPLEVTIGGDLYRRVTIFKHDSWAATALYEGHAGKVVCKFNRQQSILGVPMRWLGRWLARHESYMLDRLQDLKHVVRAVGPIYSDGKRLDNACGHRFVPGHPLGRRERVPPGFFDRLAETLRALHLRGMAYVDLHKRENILVGDDGEPCLCDFQISFAATRRWANLVAPALDLLQRADWYHFRKHCRSSAAVGYVPLLPAPWFLMAHRIVGKSFRWLRRMVLVTLGMRSGIGRAETEQFPEEAVSRELEQRKRAA